MTLVNTEYCATNCMLIRVTYIQVLTLACIMNPASETPLPWLFSCYSQVGLRAETCRAPSLLCLGYAVVLAVFEVLTIYIKGIVVGSRWFYIVR